MQIYEKEGKLIALDEQTGTIVSVINTNLQWDGTASLLLDKEKLEFLSNELGIELDSFHINLDVATATSIMRECFLIEVEEIAIVGNEELTKRGKLATSLIGSIYNCTE